MRSTGRGNASHAAHAVSVAPTPSPKHRGHLGGARETARGTHRKQMDAPLMGRVQTRHSRGKRTSREPEIQVDRRDRAVMAVVSQFEEKSVGVSVYGSFAGDLW